MNNIIIVDDFYDDPYKVREFALTCDYKLTSPLTWKYNNEKVLWQGRATETKYRDKRIDLKFSKILGSVVRIDINSGFFRMSPEKETTDHIAHIDGINDDSETHYSGIIYLNLPEHCANKKGTIFYRHVKTGKIKVHTAQEYMFINADCKNKDAWEEYDMVESRFNRLVLFESNLFHSIGDCYGSDISNSRLAQIFSLHKIA